MFRLFAQEVHLEVYAGCQKYADEAGWHCTINPAVDRTFKHAGSQLPYDGVIARSTKPIADAAQQAGCHGSTSG